MLRQKAKLFVFTVQGRCSDNFFIRPFLILSKLMVHSSVVLKEKVSFESTGTQTITPPQAAVGASGGVQTRPALHAAGGVMGGSMPSSTKSAEAIKRSATPNLETSFQTMQGND